MFLSDREKSILRSKILSVIVTICVFFMGLPYGDEPQNIEFSYELYSEKEVYEFGGLTVDVSARIVCVDGQKAELSPKEYDLLFYMIKNKGIALSREKLITEVWGYDFYGDDRTLDTHIKLLRKSLCDYSFHIVTLRGLGYRFDE